MGINNIQLEQKLHFIVQFVGFRKFNNLSFINF